MNGNHAGKQGGRGFSLVELMVTVLIIGILSAIAIPSYRAYVIRVTRTDAKVALTSTAARLERCFTRFNRYDFTELECPTGLPFNTPDATYTIAATSRTANNFDLSATPINGQAEDTACGTFQLDELGNQTVSTAKPANECW